MYSNVVTAHEILLTASVTVVSAESSFSKLKIIEHYLQSCIYQEQLTSFSIMVTENKVAKIINFDDLINEFAENQARKFL